MLQRGFFDFIVYCMIIYTDSHCHITANLNKSTPVLGRICNACQESQWEQLTSLANDKNFVCLGIHPWFVNDLSAGWDKKLYTLLVKNPKLMIGEIGLDKYHPWPDIQETVFITQMELAYNLNRPVHIHCVGAWERFLHILKELGTRVPLLTVVHSFNGDVAKIPDFIKKYNMYFSFSGKQLERFDSGTAKRIQTVPNNRILIESDTETESKELSELNKALVGISKTKEISQDVLSEQIYQNFQRVTQND